MITVKIKNYKLVKDDILEMEHGMFYLISGKNNKGKTSRQNAFESLLLAADSTPNPISKGETSGEIVMDYPGPNGEEVTVYRKMEEGAKDSYYMKVDGKLVKTVGKLREMFDYTSFSAETFVSWSKSAEGRRKQRDILLNIIPQEQKTKFFEFEEKEEELVQKRKEHKKERDAVSILVKNNQLTEEDIELIGNEEKAIAGLAQLNKEVNGADTTKLELKALEKAKKDFSDNIKYIIDAIEEIDKSSQDILYNVQLKIEEKYDKEIKALPPVDEESLAKTKVRIENGEALIKKINEAILKQSKLKDYEKEFKAKEDIVIKDESDLEKIREDRDSFVKTMDVPVENIIIGSPEEGLSYKTEEGIFKFDDNQLSTSLIYIITAKIMSHVNSKSNILIMGNAANFDSETKLEIAKYAKENDLLILADEVTDEEDITLKIVGEDLDAPAKKTTTKSTPKVKKEEPKVEKEVFEEKKDEKQQELLF